MSVENKTVIVTGAASGIGRETARILMERGARVIGFDRNRPEDNLDGFIEVDLMDPVSIDKAVDNFSGQADALCNVAGLPPTAPINKVMAVNFVGLRRFTERMLDKLSPGASIVNVASLAGIGWSGAIDGIKRFIAEADFDNVDALSTELGIDQERCYFFSKEVLRVWTMQNWNTWRDRGIRINSISPGPVETPILQDFLDTLGERAEEDMRVMGRAGESSEIAAAVVFLCSSDSSWINGTNIATDGGMEAHVMGQIYGF
ncbi:coniferyl-alcohol dehydrogenase [Pseudomaricurvus alkylphenolicus]|uniref:coniferyl-alcohol dehydrogenase n=1 Tax=Pseudomaricurvus alkylphenolicus TaxID=1306991 RepID=UPI001420E82C|nr:coniferyl-alcohol dehydrogenase [Pseudomaricurvus alkylphenolicus]